MNSKSKKSLKKRRSNSNSSAGRKKSNFHADLRHVAILMKIGKAVSNKAIRTSKALGLSITFMEKGVLYKEHPDGTREILNEGKASYFSEARSAIKSLKSGVVLNAR